MKMKLRGAARSPVVVYSVCGLLVGVVAAFLAVWLVDNPLNNVLLGETTARAIDQLQLGVLGTVTPEDFEPPFTPDRLDDLDRRLEPVRRSIRRDGSDVLRLNIFARDGTMIYSDRPDNRGEVIDPSEQPLLASALNGRLARRRSTLTTAENADLRPTYSEAFEVYVPVAFDDRVVGAYEIYQDLGPLRPIRAIVGIVAVLTPLIVFHLLGRLRESQAQAQAETRAEPLALPSPTAPPAPPAPVPVAAVGRRGPPLTPRELDVLRLLATTHSYHEIASQLVVSDETVRSHVKRILRKLGQPDRTQAVVAAMRAGLIEIDAARAPVRKPDGNGDISPGRVNDSPATHR